MTAATYTVREYLRVSFDGSGTERSNEEQAHDNAGFVDRTPALEWSGLEAYRDVGSASKYATKVRGDYTRLMADLRAGTFGADVLLVWVSSRGTRKPEEMLDLLNVCARQGVRLAVTTHERIYNPDNAHDWGALVKDAVDDALYSAKISEAVRRAMKRNAEQGRSNGGRRAFGYTKDGALDPVEAPLVREAVRRVLGGESTRSVAKDWNARGILTSAGNPWHPGPLRNMVGGPRIAGIRVHHGKIMDRCQWDAIISRDEHARVVAVLANRTPVGRRGRTPWLLTGLLRCELCGAALVSQQDTRGTRRYICRKGPGYRGCGRLTIKAEPTEELLGLLATDRLGDVDARRAAQADDEGDAAELAELSRIAAARVAVADDYAAGRYGKNPAQRWEDVAALDRAQAAAEAALAAKVRDTGPLDFVSTEGLVGRRWEDLTEREDRRRVLDATIRSVTIGPASVKGSTRYEADRVQGPGRIDWKV